MPLYRKKPVVIHAERCATLIHDAATNWGALPPWFRDVYETGKIIIAANQIHIRTLEGVMTANSDDWVICGVKAEVYPCKADIFAETYEPA